jgi:hypothetical protein
MRLVESHLDSHSVRIRLDFRAGVRSLCLACRPKQLNIILAALFECGHTQADHLKLVPHSFSILQIYRWFGTINLVAHLPVQKSWIMKKPAYGGGLFVGRNIYNEYDIRG